MREIVRGRVFLPGDDGFDRAAAPWAVGVRQPVVAVAEAADADDVVALVRYARRAGLTVTAQPSGHGASGDVDGMILLRTGRLDEVAVDPARRLVRAGAGARWGQVLAATGKHGLTGLAGSSPVVSVAGFVAGGGISWFGRRYGWAADSVRAFEIVSAEGEPVRVTASSDADLFWALRGGGGDYGIITAVELDLYEVPGLYGGRIVWPATRTGEVFEAFRAITADAPRELSLWLNRMAAPPPAPATVGIDVTFLGEVAEVEELLAPLAAIGGSLSDSRGPMDVAGLGAIAAEPVDPSPMLARTELLTDLPVGVLAGAELAPLLNMQVRHLGGALAEARPDGGPGGALGEPYLLHLLGLRLPHLAEAVRARQAALVAHAGEAVSGRKPYTFLAPGESAAQAFPAEAAARLARIKRERDPGGVICANFPVTG
ncbi:FAD/FMN-containing dehydrogenase [Nonomuraea thailandensis]|uniref:FAD/FMN-containing dehydrogenase n=1 Tax=Nonomuraea thailandensis TaxID=1188745 RepID=A0A9X2K1S0_9ACTN|nr:FAD-dependent oxidoreductase [Nonomuraea thailandensis]MCP2356634.1 FAD/FMN-containing dehydrogenase [Nonomuraea thailandensis]